LQLFGESPFGGFGHVVQVCGEFEGRGPAPLL
jgi:hypothetical protein